MPSETCRVSGCRRHVRHLVFADADPYSTVAVCDKPTCIAAARRSIKGRTRCLVRDDWVAEFFPRPERTDSIERDVALCVDLKVFGSPAEVFKAAEAIIADLVTRKFDIQSAEIIDEEGEIIDVNIASAVEHRQHGDTAAA